MVIRSRFYVLVVTISCLFCANASAQETVGCQTVLANLFEKEYCAEDYKLDTLQEYVFAERAAYKGQDPEKAVEQAPYQLLFDKLWSTGLAKVFPAANFNANEKEYDLFLAAYRSVRYAEKQGLEMRLAAINELLRNRKFNPEKRTYLRDERDKVRDRLKVLEAHSSEDSYDEKTQEQLDFQIRSTGRSIIQKWKENKLLYQKYGGKSVVIDKNIEPLEAMLAQFEYLEKDGQLAIYNEKYKAFYDERKAQVQQALSRHETIDDKARIEKFYTVPYWLQDAVDAKEPHVQSLIKLYEDIGYRGQIPEAVKNVVLESSKNE